MKRLAVLISGTGRNLQAIIDAVNAGTLPARIVRVISNRPRAAGLQRARDAGIETCCISHGDYPTREAFDAALAAELEAIRPDIIALAGFMRVLGDDFVRSFEGRLLNIHPSLLPKYRGLNTHQRVLEAGDTEHGASVHFVTPELDGGPVVLQGRIAVHTSDDRDSLAERVMREVEQRIYPLALSWMATGRLEYRQGDAWLDGERLAAPRRLEDLVDSATIQPHPA